MNDTPAPSLPEPAAADAAELTRQLSQEREKLALATAALKETEDRYRALFDRSLDCLFVHDFDGRFIDANPAALALLGYSREEIPTITFQSLLTPDQMPLAMQCVAEVKATGAQRTACEFHLKNKQGESVVVESMCCLVVRTGAPPAILGLARDVTARKKLEANVARVQRMESIGTLASGIAHDLNNVLAPIMISCQLLAEPMPESERLPLLDLVSRSAHRGAELIRQMLSISRGMGVKRIDIQVKSLLTEIRHIVTQTFPKSIRIQSKTGRDLWTVTADPTQLHQVLLNLCVNARDAMPAGGTLTITAENVWLNDPRQDQAKTGEAAPYLMLGVTDTGAGIPREIREKIFDPFFTTKELGKGTGLGLSTSLAIIKSHGGFIDVSSELGKGSAFQIYLPALIAAEAPGAKTEESRLPRGNGELVLIVDDEPAIREIYKKTLQAFGYSVITACDGAEAVALQSLHAAALRAVLIDMTMPVLDGPATIHAIFRRNPRLKFIAASGLPPETHLPKCPADSVKAFLHKPYTAAALLTTLHDVLQGNAAA